MSFDPLPTSLVRDLEAIEASSDGVVVELGCGDGRLADHLKHHTSSWVGLDHRLPIPVPGIMADALDPPLRPECAGVVLAANVVRHLSDDGGIPANWSNLVAPGGALWIMEDEPVADGEPGALYRDLQRCLDRLVPGRKGTLRSLDWFRAKLRDQEGWTFGSERNLQPVNDPTALLAGLDRYATEDPEVAAIAAAIRREGLDYGRYWWARRVRENRS